MQLYYEFLFLLTLKPECKTAISIFFHHPMLLFGTGLFIILAHDYYLAPKSSQLCRLSVLNVNGVCRKKPILGCSASF